MGYFAVFLEPQGELRQEIISLKNLVNASLPGQKYDNHPPHCTLIFGSYQNPDLWINELQTAINPCTPFSLNTDGFHIFYDDQPAGGGHTVVFRIVKTDPLFNLQTRVGEVLSGYQDGRAENSSWFNETLRASMERYGFPFVGDHWFPHFSIASLKVRRNSRFLKYITQRPASFTDWVNELSIWKVDGDQHLKLYTLYLKGICQDATQN